MENFDSDSDDYDVCGVGEVTHVPIDDPQRGNVTEEDVQRLATALAEDLALNVVVPPPITAAAAAQQGSQQPQQELSVDLVMKPEEPAPTSIKPKARQVAVVVGTRRSTTRDQSTPENLPGPSSSRQGTGLNCLTTNRGKICKTERLGVVTLQPVNDWKNYMKKISLIATEVASHRSRSREPNVSPGRRSRYDQHFDLREWKNLLVGKDIAAEDYIDDPRHPNNIKKKLEKKRKERKEETKSDTDEDMDGVDD